MIIKKFVHINDESTIALKFSPAKNMCAIIGKSNLMDTMLILCLEYFDMDKPKWHQTNNIKGRFVFKCSLSKFVEAVKEMKSNHYYVEDVKILGDIGR